MGRHTDRGRHTRGQGKAPRMHSRPHPLINPTLKLNKPNYSLQSPGGKQGDGALLSSLQFYLVKLQLRNRESGARMDHNYQCVWGQGDPGNAYVTLKGLSGLTV